MTGTSHALLTPSFRGDLDRCRLLCASIDRFVTGANVHYLLVDDRDVPLFRPFESATRRIIAEGDLLPSWLRSWPDPLSRGKRRVWTGPGALARGVMPLRGWHIQQLLKMTAPTVIDEDVLLYADSDVVFLKPFDMHQLVDQGRVRLFRKPGGVRPDMANHVKWAHGAASILGLPQPPLPAHDYITNLVCWTNANARHLLKHIEAVSGRNWISAVTAGRGFSEWMIYGQFVSDVLGERSGHLATDSELVRTWWFSHEVNRDILAPGALVMEQDEVALGVQSFIGMSMDSLWDVFRHHAAQT